MKLTSVCLRTSKGFPQMSTPFMKLTSFVLKAKNAFVKADCVFWGPLLRSDVFFRKLSTAQLCLSWNWDTASHCCHFHSFLTNWSGCDSPEYETKHTEIETPCTTIWAWNTHLSRSPQLTDTHTPTVCISGRQWSVSDLPSKHSEDRWRVWVSQRPITPPRALCWIPCPIEPKQPSPDQQSTD